MSEGRIEQVGTPFEIYNFPATRVRRLVRRHAQPAGRPASSMPAAGTPLHRRPGGPHRAARHERRRRATGSPSRSGPRGSTSARARTGANRLRGQVEDVNFLGSIVRIRVALRRRRRDGPTTARARQVQRAAPDAARGRRGRRPSRSRPRPASSSRDDRRRTPSRRSREARRRPARRRDLAARRDRPRRLRQGRHADRLPRDVERLGPGPRGGPGGRDRARSAGAALPEPGLRRRDGPGRRARPAGGDADGPHPRLDPGGPARRGDRPGRRSGGAAGCLACARTRSSSRSR